MQVLFVCTGNSCRSVMAEWYFNKRAGERDVPHRAFSRGIAPARGMPPTDETYRVMSEYGLDVSSHRAQALTRHDSETADLIFVMEKVHKECIGSMYPDAIRKTYFLKEFRRLDDFHVSENPDIPDPIGRGIDTYRRTCAVIRESVERIFEALEG